ncbi:MAG: indolepyruvate ferredoxin oxidoreductase subunit alpha [Thermanaeromonas sp.]|uniref:indolepyruvate ferredoxin oxidoreductase subunit alpha n=1 Tax=Thermanaeromonas sp. TaxID=2003697 RepID=UPI0024381BBC|nr:indolepyruvate ferredoxin oxidoreductase subunit alpha [Thermanaeromonas sp.]MCG0277171.1 indolepyruvate ferredoxin oxidoreductase subunit alpha [Thermanaeromonas sp.]
MREVMLGNHAVARGAWEAGVRVAAAYPGTPSTEIIEALAQYPDVYAEWSVNEKVALEVAAGAAIAGARALAAMKHVGVNVASDALMTLAYTGINAGLVLVSADDPNLYSSQNEQDNRLYARFAQIPCLEPADSQEAKEMTKVAFALSEAFDTPVMLRLTTRIAHSQSLVELGEREEVPLKPYTKAPSKYVMLPAFGRERHKVVEERRAKLSAYAEITPLNRVEWGDRRVGVITSGISYQYVKEALPGVSVLKLGLTYPLPKNLIRQFIAAVDVCFVVEELEPFLEEQISSWGLPVRGKEFLPRIGEFDPRVVVKGIGPKVAEVNPALLNESLLHDNSPSLNITLPARPPVMCPGCPHRGVFYILRKLKLTVAGDIGCYTLGASPPLNAMDTCICMGASMGVALGMEKARGQEFSRGLVAVIGDSTFLHAGMTGLLDIVYNQGTTTVIILDNGTTAMTGHQDHPGTGYTASRALTTKIDLEQVVRGLGIRRVQVVDPYDLTRAQEVISAEVATPEPSVIIARRLCALLAKGTGKYRVVGMYCRSCQCCLDLGCPALTFNGEEAVIDEIQCTGCGLCAQICPAGAIEKVVGENA